MLRRLFSITMLATLLAAVAPGAGAENAWKKLLSLAGEWEGAEGGGTATLTYAVVAGGNAVMETLKPPAPEPEMITMYHRDGDALVATHYCSAGNQPRMRAAGLTDDGKSIRFRFADITNLKSPDGVHIRHLTVTFDDDNRLTQEWTGAVKVKSSDVFRWTRKAKK